MVRLGGAEGMNQIAADNNFSVPAVVEAGEHVAELVAMEPFQEGFLAATWDAPDGESGVMASQGAAMDLMGSWGLGAFRNQAGLAEQPETPLPFEIGWFPFPEVEGGAGAPTDAFGGGDGFIVGKDAPPETVDFLGFLTNVENQRTWATAERNPREHRSHRRHHRDPGCRWPRDADGSRRADRRDVHAAVPRPVLHGRSRCPGQRPDGAALRR